jgi:AcrR family transcriptional regulator
MSTNEPVLPNDLERQNRANPRQRAQRAATREKLVEGAVRVFAEKGYASATVDDVLSEAGVSRASFYAHFPSKVGLISAVADSFVPLWQPMYEELAAMQVPDQVRLEDWCRRNVALYWQNETTCLILTQATAIESDLYWKIAGFQNVLIDMLARKNAALAHLETDEAGRHRAAFALSQLDQACYFLTVRRSQQDPEAAIVAMAAQLLHFFESEMARGAPL